MWVQCRKPRALDHHSCFEWNENELSRGPPQQQQRQLYSLSSSRRLRGGAPAKPDGGRVPLRAECDSSSSSSSSASLPIHDGAPVPPETTTRYRHRFVGSPTTGWGRTRAVRVMSGLHHVFMGFFGVQNEMLYRIVGHYRLSTTFRRSAGTRPLTVLSLQSRILAARNSPRPGTKVLVYPYIIYITQKTR